MSAAWAAGALATRQAAELEAAYLRQWQATGATCNHCGEVKPVGHYDTLGRWQCEDCRVQALAVGEATRQEAVRREVSEREAMMGLTPPT